MITSLYRILAIGRNTLTEAIRQKVLSVLLIFALVLVSCSVLVSQLAGGLDASSLFEEQIKYVKDFGCGAIGLFGFAIALLSTAQLIPQELHNRTIYTILAKPVRRSEFLLGSFWHRTPPGVVRGVMSLAFAAALYWQEEQGLAAVEATDTQSAGWEKNPYLVDQYNHDVQQIKEQVRDPQLIEAVVLIFAKLVMTTGIALLISTFATSSIFTIVTTS